MERSPLDCPSCNKELHLPFILPCLHTICETCIPKDMHCPCCGKEFLPEEIPSPDRLATFLVEASHEETEACSNCDETQQPMYYCEKCEQSLCGQCKNTTHQAKMFSSHRIVRSEERARVRGRTTCEDHGDPYILFCSDQKSLVCIECFNQRTTENRQSFVSIDSGHKAALEKLEKLTMRMKLFQEEKKEEFDVRQRIMAESGKSFEAAKNSLFQLCQQIIDTVMATRDRLLTDLINSRDESEKACKQQLEQITTILDPIRLCLLSSQILCVSASKLDVLQMNGELSKRVQSILARTVDKLPAQKTSDPIEARSDIAKALEPYLGMSAAWCPLSVSRDGSREGSGSAPSYKTRSGSHISQSMPPMLSKFQAMIDLAGAFGNLFARVDGPIKNMTTEIGELSRRVQEAQRDITMRRCLLKSEYITALIKESMGVETQLGMHSAILNDMQSDMQQIWQEQLDRVRRQQIIYREKVEECMFLRDVARQVLNASKQLAPFATCLENMSALINPKRCHPPDPAPMESICLQISTIAPDSESRIQAIEKEEQNRRAVQEAKKQEEIAERGTAVKILKHGKQRRKEPSRLLVNTNRERSPGGTDTALLSPCVKRISPTVREETVSDLEMEGVVWADESFDLSGEGHEQTDTSVEEEARCSSSLSVSLCPSPTLSLVSTQPSDAMLGRSPLATRVTIDVGSSRMTMMQSLHDVFAHQKTEEKSDVIEEPNVSASAVKTAQKKAAENPNGPDVPVERLTIPAVQEIEDTPEPKPKPKKTRRRRDSSRVEAEEKEFMSSPVPIPRPDSILISVVPDVPYVPSSIFIIEESTKLSCFEAKEKVLQSLIEKLGRQCDIEEDEVCQT